MNLFWIFYEFVNLFGTILSKFFYESKDSFRSSNDTILPANFNGLLSFKMFQRSCRDSRYLL